MSVEHGIPASILSLKMVTLVFGIFYYKKNTFDQPCVIANNPPLTSQSAQQHEQKAQGIIYARGIFYKKYARGIIYDLSDTTRTPGSSGKVFRSEFLKLSTGTY